MLGKYYGMDLFMWDLFVGKFIVEFVEVVMLVFGMMKGFEILIGKWRYFFGKWIIKILLSLWLVKFKFNCRVEKIIIIKKFFGYKLISVENIFCFFGSLKFIYLW